MDVYGSRTLRTFAVGIATAVLVSAPPLELSALLDRALYDTNARMTAGAPPAELLLVELDDPAWLSSLASLAYRHGAELLVSTLPRPPMLPQLELLGPTALSVGSSAMLRPTPWREGGHLSLALDTDGVLRFDRPLLEDIPPLPSLGLAAAQHLLGAGAIERDSRTVVAAAPYRFSTDPSGRRWLRFYDAAGIATSTPHEIAAHPDLLAGRIVIAGAGERVYPTPIGRLSAREVVAESFIGYWHNDAIGVGWPGALLAWCLLGVSLGAAWLLRPATTAQNAITCVSIGLAVLVCSQVIAFRWLSLWLPIAAPLLATLAALAYWVSRQATFPTRAVSSAPTKPAASPASPIDAARDAPVPDLLPVAPDNSGPAREPSTWSGEEAATANAGEHAAAAASLPMLGRYELMRCIGHGAMGSVYLARDTTINRSVALKAIDLATEFDPDEIDEAGERFLREAETAGRLNHPNIVTIFDAGRVGGTAYIAMEYLTGTRLSEHRPPKPYCRQRSRSSSLPATAEALAYAHEQQRRAQGYQARQYYV